MSNPNGEEFFVIRLPNGQYVKKVHSDGSSSTAKRPSEGLQFSRLEEAEGYVSQYLHRDANCISIVKVMLTIETVRESCIG